MPEPEHIVIFEGTELPKPGGTEMSKPDTFIIFQGATTPKPKELIKFEGAVTAKI